MTEPAPPADPVPAFELVGDPTTEVCEGDACLLPAPPESSSETPRPDAPPR